MKKVMWRSLLVAFVLCLSLLPTAALADETTAPCTDGQHTWYYGNPNCTECGAPLRAAVSWDHSSVGGRYTDVKNAFEDAKLHTDSGVVPYTITLLADAELDGSVEIGHSKIQLYLDGYTLTLVPGGDAQSAIRVPAGRELVAGRSWWTRRRATRTGSPALSLLAARLRLRAESFPSLIRTAAAPSAASCA